MPMKLMTNIPHMKRRASLPFPSATSDISPNVAARRKATIAATPR
jgi:hypothetical protein